MRDITLVTGASGGIGADLARELSARGRDVALTARTGQALDALAGEIEAAGRTRPPVVALDLGEPGAADRLVAGLAEQGARVTELVNNAGFGLTGDAAALDRSEQVSMIDLNVRALTDLTLACLPAIREARGGILNVASTAAFQPGPGMAVYYATKAFVLSFSEALWEELRREGVRVTALCPGLTATGFQARARMQGRLLDRLTPMSAAAVATAGADGFLRGDRVVIPGPMNKLTAALGPLAPRRLVLPVVGRLQRPPSRRRGREGTAGDQPGKV